MKMSQKNKWDFELNLFQFLHFYKNNRKYTTTFEVPKFVMDNFNDSFVKEWIAKATKRFQK